VFLALSLVVFAELLWPGPKGNHLLHPDMTRYVSSFTTSGMEGFSSLLSAVIESADPTEAWSVRPGSCAPRLGKVWAWVVVLAQAGACAPRSGAARSCLQVLGGLGRGALRAAEAVVRRTVSLGDLGRPYSTPCRARAGHAGTVRGPAARVPYWPSRAPGLSCQSCQYRPCRAEACTPKGKF
jgi:hypothetical protein